MEQSASVATGVPQLDLILGGGMVPGALLLLAGPPGTGKTVLAAQIASTIAARNERVVFITAFSEPHNKLLTNLRNFSFFRQDYLGDRIKLLNIQHQLLSSLDEAADTIVREVREHKASLLVLDGLQGILMASTTATIPHQFLFDLSAKLSLLDVTAVITYDLSAVTETTRPELTAVDGMVVLGQDLIGDHAIRTLKVTKHRGTEPLDGRHTFKITRAGVTCFPRLESIAGSQDVDPPPERVGFGIPALDVMLSGGINRGTNTIIAGAEGVGKTLLSLHYLKHGIDNNQPGLYLTFHETPRQLIARAAHFGIDLQPALDAGTLQIQHYSPAEINPDEVAQNLRQALEQRQVQRLVIDGLHEIERTLIERGRAHHFFAALIAYLRSSHITTCITLEIDPVIGHELSFAGKNLSALSDNILLMRHIETRARKAHTLVILKMRFSAHDRLSHEYSIEATGIVLNEQPLSTAADGSA